MHTGFRDRLVRRMPSERFRSLTLISLGIWQTYRMARHPTIIYAVQGAPWMEATALLIELAFGFAIPALVLEWRFAPKTWVFSFLGLSTACLLAAQAFVLFASPAPSIDVFTIAREALQRLAHGVNPYIDAYPDIYMGTFQYAPRLSYPPGYLYLIAPSAGLGDVRWASVAAVAITLLGLYRLGGRQRFGFQSAWVWASFPMSLFVIEQAWVDVLLVPFGVWSALFLRQRRWGLAAVLLGFAVTVKQFALGLVFFACLWVLRAAGFRIALRFAFISAAVCAAILLPWLIWDARAFWVGTVGNFFAFPPRNDALTWNAYALQELQRNLPRELILGATALAFGISVVWSLRRSPGSWAFGAALFFMVGFLFAKQAFCNYYAWIASLLWMGMTERFDETASH
jgi:hypothetical protein